MALAAKLRDYYPAAVLRQLAAPAKDANQSRCLLSLAAAQEGMNQTEVARIGGTDRQTLRDWVHRFNKSGPDGLKDTFSKGNPLRLSASQQGALAALVDAGLHRSDDGVVRWRRVD